MGLGDRATIRKMQKRERLQKSIQQRRRRHVLEGRAEPDLSDPIQVQVLQTEQRQREQMMFTTQQQGIKRAVVTDDKFEEMWKMQLQFDRRVQGDIENQASMLNMIVSEFERGLNTLTDTNVF